MIKIFKFWAFIPRHTCKHLRHILDTHRVSQSSLFALCEQALNTQLSLICHAIPWCFPPCPIDPLHTYLGLSGLSLNGEKDISPVHAPLNISQRAMDWLRQVQSRHKYQWSFIFFLVMWCTFMLCMYNISTLSPTKHVRWSTSNVAHSHDWMLYCSR